MVATEIW